MDYMKRMYPGYQDIERARTGCIGKRLVVKGYRNRAIMECGIKGG